MESTSDCVCDCCGDKYENLQGLIFHRPLCAKSLSNPARFKAVHDALGIAANKIQDLRHTGYFSEARLQELTNMVADIQKEIG